MPISASNFIKNHAVGAKIPLDFWNKYCFYNAEYDARYFQNPDKQINQITLSDLPRNKEHALLFLCLHYPNTWDNATIESIISLLNITSYQYLAIRSMFNMHEAIQWTQTKNTSNEATGISADLFINACALGQIDTLLLIKKLVPTEIEALIAVNSFNAFRQAASHGHLEVLRWLKAQSPTQLQAMIAAKTFDAFKVAARYGHLEVLKWLQEQAPPELLEKIAVDTFEAFSEAARYGHLEVLKWFKAVASIKLQAMIAAATYEAFRWAALGGHLEVLKWFKEVAPAKLQERIDADTFDAFRWVASGGHLEVLEWFKALAPTKLQAMIALDDFSAFGAAAKYGHLEVLKWLQKQAPTKLQEMIAADTFYAFREAGTNGHLEVLKWLQKQAPTKLQEMIAAKTFEAFRWAARYAHLEVLKWLQVQSPTQQQSMLAADNFYAFREAASNGHLEVVRWLNEQVPTQQQEMIAANDLYGFREAIRMGHLEVSQCLLLKPQCLAHAEMHEAEYGARIVIPYINNRLNELKTKSQAYGIAHPNGVFDLTDAEEIQSCLIMIRNLVRRNLVELNDDLRFLLTIPAVKALAHTAITPHRDNELLRLAISIGNAEVAAILLTVPAIFELAQRNEFYGNEASGGLDLAALASDCESSMTALTVGEKKRLDAAIIKYQDLMQQTGVSQVMTHLREELLARYEKAPAQITVKNKVLVLPAEWEQFIKLDLKGEKYQEALKAYSQNKNHTAWRYLSRPNHWMAHNASYVYVNPRNHAEKWSSFEEYQTLISIMWLAAFDSKTAATDGHTIEGRVEHFIDELAHIGRAHNWDNSRTRPDGATEEYDDLRGDKPSCYSGVKRRLFQSVVGHPLLKFLSMNDIEMEFRDFVREHFKDAITDANRTAIKAAFDWYFENADYGDETKILKTLDITEEKVQRFLEELKNKYQASFTDYPEYTRYINDQLTLRKDKGKEADYAHALKLDGLAQVYGLLAAKDSAPQGRVSAHGMFSESAAKTEQVKDEKVPEYKIYS